MTTTVALSFFALLVAAAHAQVTCSGTLSSPNPITSDVIVSGSCTLSTNTTGSVMVGSGSLSTSGLVGISGTVSAASAGTINLQGTVVINGGVSVSGATSVTVGPNANVGTLMVSDTDLTHDGTATSVSFSGDGEVNINGDVTSGGVSRSDGSGLTRICGADVFGGVSSLMVTGDLNVGGTGCAASTINGAFSIEKGSGNVFISSAATTAADVIVVEHTGSVTISDTKVSDLVTSTLTGSLTVTRVDLDSDTSLTGISGALVFDTLTTQGDFSIVDAASSVTIRKSDFGLETVKVTNSAGLVTVTDNKEFNFEATGNQDVVFSGNTASSVNFANNGQVSINNNDITTSLVCSDNAGVSGTGNTIFFKDGQCSVIT